MKRIKFLNWLVKFSKQVNEWAIKKRKEEILNYNFMKDIE